MSNKALAIGAGLAVLVLVTVLIYRAWPATVPDLALQNADGDAVMLSSLRAGKEHTVAVFLLPGCPVSKFSLGVVKEQHGKWSGQATFVGLLFGYQDAATEFKEQNELPFDVYGLQSATDPFAVNELIEAIGSSHGLRSAVWGGTVIVLDEDRSVELQLEKEDVRKLPEELADMLD